MTHVDCREPIPANHHSITEAAGPSDAPRSKTKRQRFGPAVSVAATQAALDRSGQEAMHAYGASDDVLVYLIKQTMDGSPERRLAANFILDCLRKFQKRQDIEGCIHQVADKALLDVADEARELAMNVGLIR